MSPVRALKPPHEWVYWDYRQRCARCGIWCGSVPSDSPCLTDGEAAYRAEWQKEADAAARALKGMR